MQASTKRGNNLKCKYLTKKENLEIVILNDSEVKKKKKEKSDCGWIVHGNNVVPFSSEPITEQTSSIQIYLSNFLCEHIPLYGLQANLS